MEFVGRKVKKEFDGGGVLRGRVVRSGGNGIYQILYEDGSLEKLEFSDLVSRLDNEGGKIEAEPAGIELQLPNKRRRMDINGDSQGMSHDRFDGDKILAANVDLNVKAAGNLGGDELANDNCDINGGQETLEFKSELEGVLSDNASLTRNSVPHVEKTDGIDLNQRMELNLNNELDLNLNSDKLEGNSSMQNKEIKFIDLNLDVNGQTQEDIEMMETQKRECGFDLNLDVDDDSKDGGFSGETKMIEAVVTGPSSEILEERYNLNLGFIDEKQRENNIESHNDCNGVALNEEFVCPVIDGGQGEMESPYNRATSRRRRRGGRVVDNLNSMSSRVLRRSARRGARGNMASSSTGYHSANDLASSSMDGEDLAEAENAERGNEEESTVIPPKVQLPPSSRNLDLHGVPVMDFFYIYSFLRSFSTSLFLSPFELEDLEAALKCESANSLLDYIHFSILGILRKHLRQLASEGSESASHCLRNLNWNLLDLVTWPVFMVEYLLLHSSSLAQSFELSRLKLLKNEYYKQPVSVKVEILRCLCDEMIEVEDIRAELNRRLTAAEPEIEFERNVNSGRKKRRVGTNMRVDSCMTEVAGDDTNDWNSDDCCLCKMDGNLLCCDGCPAAYHSKCVGIVSELLPEGEWFCPECAIVRRKPWMKCRKTIRGAEVLGNDPHGRTYFFCCSYLLVLDVSDEKSIENYYHKDDVGLVVDVLRSSHTSYGGILEKIYKYWDIAQLHGEKNNLDSLSLRLTSLASLEAHDGLTGTVSERKPEGYSGALGFRSSMLANGLASVGPTELPNVSFKGSAEMTQLSSATQNSLQRGPYCSNDTAAPLIDHPDMLGKRPTLQDSLGTSQMMNPRKDLHSAIAYVNCYNFAPTASSVAQELMLKSSVGISQLSVKTDQQIISVQTKIILKKLDKFNWLYMQNLNLNLRKEKCGWCFKCRASSDGAGCLFNVYDNRVSESLKDDLVGLQSKRTKRGHLIDVICYILSVEERLHGLLLGPWLNPHYSKHWRKSAMKATDIVSVKHLLLMLESNMHPLVLSPEWSRHVDSIVTMGSATHIVTRAKHGIARKRAKLLDLDSKPTSSGLAGGLGLCWWRGGNISCRVFSWKVLPRSLVRIAARQGGRKRIPGILYPESSDFAKRSRNVAWRAAVESSTSVEQLAVQVREFDLHIRWDDIENTHPLCLMDKASRKSCRLFKKAIVRRKNSKEGEGVKYLVDFGKRMHVPDIVLNHGSLAEDSSSGRKKYWLSECYVPLHLVKSCEERKLARKSSSKSNSKKFSEVCRVKKKSSGLKGFSYLFAKAERSEYYQCGHCSKDVLIREAVCCKNCKGFFHKRHSRKSAGAVAAHCTYTCYKCEAGKPMKSGTKPVKADSKKGKTKAKNVKVEQKQSQTVMTTRSAQSKKGIKPVARRGRPPKSQNAKNVPAIPLRRSTRKTKVVSIVYPKQGGKGKKGKKGRKKKKKSKKKSVKPSKEAHFSMKRRTKAYYSYWLNGLRLSGKPDDERVMEFRREKLFVSAGDLNTVIDGPPKCRLCSEAGPTSGSTYIYCGDCKEWYHGDAYGLNANKMSKLIGFKCHVCRKRPPPVCHLPLEIDGSGPLETQNGAD